ncbi:hypothetical protein CHCC20335_2244 [Bacillus paralicheniformis]|nr:hypothetical protein CHCC20335_2244 [Bacillus paralicheniformis]
MGKLLGLKPPDVAKTVRRSVNMWRMQANMFGFLNTRKK